MEKTIPRIELKNERELEKIEEAAKIASSICGELSKEVKPGVSTKKLDQVALSLIRKFSLGGQANRAGKVEPAFLGYRDYPAVICVSLNQEVVHGIPNEKRIIKEGDLVSLDLGIRYEGFYGDIALTIGVGKINNSAKRLIAVAYWALQEAIKEAKVGKRIGDVSSCIQSFVEKNGFSVVQRYSGHGIGRELHEEPSVPCFGQPHTGARLLPGMVLAIETMVNEGGWEVKLLPDRWTAVTSDGSLSAHFEHMVAILETGAKLLTFYPPWAVPDSRWLGPIGHGLPIKRIS